MRHTRANGKIWAHQLWRTRLAATSPCWRVTRSRSKLAVVAVPCSNRVPGYIHGRCSGVAIATGLLRLLVHPRASDNEAVALEAMLDPSGEHDHIYDNNDNDHDHDDDDKRKLRSKAESRAQYNDDGDGHDDVQQMDHDGSDVNITEALNIDEDIDKQHVESMPQASLAS